VSCWMQPEPQLAGGGGEGIGVPKSAAFGPGIARVGSDEVTLTTFARTRSFSSAVISCVIVNAITGPTGLPLTSCRTYVVSVLVHLLTASAALQLAATKAIPAAIQILETVMHFLRYCLPSACNVPAMHASGTCQSFQWTDFPRH